MRFILTVLMSSALLTGTAMAADTSCKALPDFDKLQAALKEARAQDNGGLNNDMWGAIVDRTGKVCAVTNTGADPGDQWPGSRLIAVEKAGTANAPVPAWHGARHDTSLCGIAARRVFVWVE